MQRAQLSRQSGKHSTLQATNVAGFNIDKDPLSGRKYAQDMASLLQIAEDYAVSS